MPSYILKRSLVSKDLLIKNALYMVPRKIRQKKVSNQELTVEVYLKQFTKKYDSSIAE